MPISFEIRHELRLVVARGSGVFTDENIFDYQRSVWSRPEVLGYDELIDMSSVSRIEEPNPERIRELARLASGMDAREGKSRFAIVAPEDLAYGLGRMFQVLRELDSRSTKEVGVFRTMGEAVAFLGLTGDPTSPECRNNSA